MSAEAYRAGWRAVRSCIFSTSSWEAGLGDADFGSSVLQIARGLTLTFTFDKCPTFLYNVFEHATTLLDVHRHGNHRRHFIRTRGPYWAPDT